MKILTGFHWLKTLVGKVDNVAYGQTLLNPAVQCKSRFLYRMSWCVCWGGSAGDVILLKGRGYWHFISRIFTVCWDISGQYHRMTIMEIVKASLKAPSCPIPIIAPDNGEYIFGLLYQPWEDKRCYILMGNWIELNKGTIHKMWKTNRHRELLVVSKSRKPLLLLCWGEEEEGRFVGIQRELELKIYRKTPRDETWPLVQKSSHCQPVAKQRENWCLAPPFPLWPPDFLSSPPIRWIGLETPLEAKREHP